MRIFSMASLTAFLTFVFNACSYPEAGKTQQIHIYTNLGDTAAVKTILEVTTKPKALINSFDSSGMTPLMIAAKSTDANVDMLHLLLNNGASVNIRSRGNMYAAKPALSFAIGAGNPEKVALLLEYGADLHYQYSGNYDAIIDAMHGRNIARNDHLMELLTLLVDAGANVLNHTKYCESGIQVASNRGRFDAVELLLTAGADETALEWTPLMKAIAFDDAADVRHLLEANADLEARDSWERTPWLLAVQTGDIRKARLLLEYNANTDARGNTGKPALFYAIANGHEQMLRWLLDLGISPEQADDSGTTALIEAAEYDNVEAIDILLSYGARVDGGKIEATPEYKASLNKMFGDDEDLSSILTSYKSDETALSYASTREAALRLLAAGADPAQLNREARRTILGFKMEETDEFRFVSRKDFKQGRNRRYGTTNPEEIHEPFWEAMVRSGANAWSAKKHFEGWLPEEDTPVWCADRFGQSLTLLPDGRIIEIGGEHEDWYDPDFAIFNDVFVHDGKEGINIYSYPESVFPPTDFHTATLVGQHIYIIGALGYPEKRHNGETPIYRLHLDDFHIEKITATGDEPGWIFKHHAYLAENGVDIHVRGGTVSKKDEKGDDQHLPNTKEYVLNLEKRVWRVAEDG